MNVAVAPLTCQLPAIFGESVGSGVEGESAEENVSVIGPPPLAACVPSAGDTDSSAQRPCRGGRGGEAPDLLSGCCRPR